MITRVQYTVMLITGLLMTGNATAIQAGEEPSGVERLLKELAATDAGTSGKAQNELHRVRQTAIERLLVVLARNTEADVFAQQTTYNAIQFLGEWRAAEASELLVERIEFPELLVALIWSRGPFMRYPAARALVSIGGPAAEKIIERMAKPVNETELKLFAFVIQEIDGTELGRARLELALAKAEKKEKKKGTKPLPRPEQTMHPGELNPEKLPEKIPEEKGPKEDLQRENLSRLLELYKKLDFDSIEDWPLPKPMREKFKGLRRTPIRE